MRRRGSERRGFSRRLREPSFPERLPSQDRRFERYRSPDTSGMFWSSSWDSRACQIAPTVCPRLLSRVCMIAYLERFAKLAEPASRGENSAGPITERRQDDEMTHTTCRYAAPRRDSRLSEFTGGGPHSGGILRPAPGGCLRNSTKLRKSSLTSTKNFVIIVAVVQVGCVFNVPDTMQSYPTV